MIKVAIIGDGSAKFARRLARDILIAPELRCSKRELGKFWLVQNNLL